MTVAAMSSHGGLASSCKMEATITTFTWHRPAGEKAAHPVRGHGQAHADDVRLVMKRSGRHWPSRLRACSYGGLRAYEYLSARRGLCLPVQL